MSENRSGDIYPRYGYEDQYGVRIVSPVKKEALAEDKKAGHVHSSRDSGVIMEQKGIFSSMSQKKIRSSVLVVGALVLAVGGFAVLVMNSYPGKGGDANVPIVRADKVAFKERMSEPSGMAIANSDSTVYETFRGNSAEREVENLLRKSGQPMDKLEAFAQQVEEKLKEQEMEKAVRMAASEEEQSRVLQKIAPASGENNSVDEPGVVPASKPKVFHKAGESPETIDFIRSVLRDKELQKNSPASAPAMVKVVRAPNVAAQVADIAPAAGAAVSAGTYTSGLYFVQLASIGERTRAPSEWSKMQKFYTGGLLQQVKYRVVKADLGAKGVFYRIQAGPFSKSDAQSLCNSIKAQKPGGCFVVK